MLLRVSLLLASWLSLTAKGVMCTVTRISEGTVPFVVKGETFKTYYKVHGSLNNSSLPPLVVVHGGPGFTHDYLIPMSDIAKRDGQAVLFYDQLGNGKSSRLVGKPADFFSVELYVDELDNLLTRLAIKEYHLFGHSWGGPLAAYFDIKVKPPGLRSLIITNSLANFPDGGRSTAERIATLDNAKEVTEGFRLRYNDIKKFRAALLSLHSHYAYRFVKRPLPKELHMADVLLGDEKTGKGGDYTVNLNMGAVTANFTIVDELPQIRVPTLLITAQWDMVQSWCSEPYFWGVEGRIKWVQFEKSSHVPFWEEREEYMKLIGTWIGSINPGSIS